MMCINEFKWLKYDFIIAGGSDHMSNVRDIKRIYLNFAPNIKIRFVGRDLAIQRVIEWAEEGMWKPAVIFGPKGCGKTAWLKQSIEILKSYDYDVIYVNPFERILDTTLGVASLKKRLTQIFREALKTNVWGGVINTAIDVVREDIRVGRGKIAVIIDEAFQMIKTIEASSYIKALLGVMEHPPSHYERIVAIVATSEGRSRAEIGRHEWSDLIPMWNMSKNDFRELYDQIPGEKPSFEDVWRITGGNPRILRELYKSRWDINEVLTRIIRSKRLSPNFIKKWSRYLEKIIEDPDYLWSGDVPERLLDILLAKNLVIDNLYEREPRFWIDQPPPRKDLEIGVGEEVAWQTPLHREAVRRALEKFGT